MNSLAATCCLLLLFSTTVMASPGSGDLSDTSLKRKYYTMISPDPPDLPSSSSTPALIADDLEDMAILAAVKALDSTDAGSGNHIGTGNGHILTARLDLGTSKEPEPYRKLAKSTEQSHQEPSPSDQAIAQSQQGESLENHASLKHAKRLARRRELYAEDKAAIAAGVNHPNYHVAHARATRRLEVQRAYDGRLRDGKGAVKQKRQTDTKTKGLSEERRLKKLKIRKECHARHLAEEEAAIAACAQDPSFLLLGEHVIPRWINEREMVDRSSKRFRRYRQKRRAEQRAKKEASSAASAAVATDPLLLKALECNTRIFTVPTERPMEQSQQSSNAWLVDVDDAVKNHNNAKVWWMLDTYNGHLPIDFEKLLETAVLNKNHDFIRGILPTNHISSHHTLRLALEAAVSIPDPVALNILFGFWETLLKTAVLNRNYDLINDILQTNHLSTHLTCSLALEAAESIADEVALNILHDFKIWNDIWGQIDLEPVERNSSYLIGPNHQIRQHQNHLSEVDANWFERGMEY